MQTYVEMHATAWMNEQHQHDQNKKQKQKQKQKAPLHPGDRSADNLAESSASALALDTTSSYWQVDSAPSSPVVNTYATSIENTSSSVISSASSAELDPPSQKPSLSRKVTIQDFQILKVLGKGCMGKVILVREHRTSRLFALKAISKQFVVMHREVEHAKSEREILARIGQISHPFLIRLHHSFQDASQLFLVFDYHVGGDMATQLAKCYKFSPGRCRLYTAEILLGIQELHRLGILYRDLKPENILLGADGHIILTDFGLSKQFLPQTNVGDQRTTTFCGTAEYLAPEILRGDEYSFAVDFWSLGTLLYEMITGIPPFWAENHADMYNRVLDDNLEFPPNFDTVTADFITGLLHRVPQDRLGAGPYGPQEIRSHPYFAGMDWSDVYRKRIKPEYIPMFKSETDLQNFDDTFVAMTPRFSLASDGEFLSPSIQGDFDGYSYTGASMHFDDSHQVKDDIDDDEQLQQTQQQLRQDLTAIANGNQETLLESFFPGYVPEENRDSLIDPWAYNGQIIGTPTPDESSEADYSSDSQNQDWFGSQRTTQMVHQGDYDDYYYTTRSSSNATIDDRRSSRPPVTPDQQLRVSPFSMARAAGNLGTSYGSSSSFGGYSEIRTKIDEHYDMLENELPMESLSIDDRSKYNTTPTPFRDVGKNNHSDASSTHAPTLRRSKDMFTGQ
ncbi:hypothetical protein K450DRAFT_249499 [Umbelopsis ramanniana AG]|uniref:Uncharacterized protein n=1 Tax=Umbelopsis ramanniana AG TaxID=1314678 RepID=A0AAD5E7E0_UMBRA|nr:uncharacterized protein K450DRAFT_249499 [Umbelopsis ramanniana AG]KAI8578014.1 hypothetical protein K450DRAFT_249499 [Umbelopsis ramanniana AG]